jgi:hypothetical protein
MKFLDQRELREKRLQEELENEKRRFVESSKLAVYAVQRNLVLDNWLKAYPTETLTFVAVASFAAGYVIAKSQMRPSLDIPSRV